MDLLATDAKASRTLLFYDKGLGFPTHYVQNVIIGSNSVALAAAAHKCTEMNIIPVVVTSSLCGSASQVCSSIFILLPDKEHKLTLKYL